MKPVTTIGAAKFKEQCLALLDSLDAQGLVITKHGQPVARLIPYPKEPGSLIGSLRDKISFTEIYSQPDWHGTLMINLDTHVLIHALNDEVRPRERTLLRDNPWGISAIVLWELAKLIQLGRISLDLSDPSVDTVLSGIHVWPLDLDVARTSTRLDFRGDPADELIAATSIVNRVPLLTRDKRIQGSNLVPLA